MGIENGDNLRKAEEVVEGSGVEQEVTSEQIEESRLKVVEESHPEVVAQEQPVEQKAIPEPSPQLLQIGPDFDENWVYYDTQDRSILRLDKGDIEELKTELQKALESGQITLSNEGFKRLDIPEEQKEIKKKLKTIESTIQALIQSNNRIPKDVRERILLEREYKDIDRNIQGRIDFISNRKRLRLGIGKNEIQALESLRESIKAEFIKYSQLQNSKQDIVDRDIIIKFQQLPKSIQQSIYSLENPTSESITEVIEAISSYKTPQELIEKKQEIRDKIKEELKFIHSHQTIIDRSQELGISEEILQEAMQDEGVQEAVVEGVINCLAFGKIDKAKEILECLEGEEAGYKKRFLEANQEELNSSIVKILGVRNIDWPKDFLEYFEGEEVGYKARFLEENREKLNNILLRLLEYKDITKFKDFLEYFEGEEAGYKKRFLEANQEELNNILLRLLEDTDITNFKEILECIENNFLVDIIKQNQGQEKELLKGYFNCKAEGIIKESNYQDILELVDRLPILNITIVKEYLEAKSNQKETEYLDKIIKIADKMISGGITEEENSKEYFQDLLEYTYPNNAHQYGKYESVKTCQDRSQDLEVFNIKEKYPIDIVDKGKLELREGRELDKRSLENIQKEREDIMKVYSEGGIDNIRQRLDEIIEEMISKMEEENTLGIELDKLMNQEEKIYTIMLYSRLNKGIKAEDIKKNILYYNFAYLDNIERYQTYADEGIEKSYEQIMELSEFYKDTIKEAQNIIIEKGKKNPIFEGVKENIYIENQERERREELGRLQVDKLGLNDKFINDMRNILIKRRLRKDTTEEERIELENKYSLDRVREIISRYESMTGFLEEKASNSPDSNTKTFYGRLKGQRNKTIEAFKTLTGEEQDLLTTHLGNINLKEVIDLKISASNGIYDEELFDRLIQQSISNLYQEEYAILETEANKFSLADYDKNGKKIEKKPKKLNAYISKDALSAYARRVGGVCVAGCNPDKGSKNIWDMPNYFQLVLQNPENKKCVGLVLLHHFEDENGQKILSASYNPSSTYLFSVDEGALFNELNNTLIEFAEENNFDKIVISKNGGIRTNRTDTIFATSMDKAINQYKDNNNGDGTYSFSENKDFSYYPWDYQLKDMDIVWSR